ncbi:MAG: alpha-amylase family glycosyl hydrolase, partial [Clostridium sp.]
MQEKWWKEAVFYQIYPRSFKDSNGDGIGDLRGIIEKLDYLKSLGVDVIWLCPIYDSPNDDNGYDIRDYYKIMEEFGTMEDFEDMLKQVHARGMKLIMDLVVNHTSDEHKWFQEALSQEDSKYEEYYKFVASSDGNPPNNWTSFFSGSAWNYYEHKDKWALHLFSKKQIDLNWDNEDLRKDIYKMINWWLGRGVDGFRLDVINYISKEAGLPKGNEAIGKLMGFYGVESYFYGPNLHKYLKEMREETFDKYGA